MGTLGGMVCILELGLRQVDKKDSEKDPKSNVDAKINIIF